MADIHVGIPYNIMCRHKLGKAYYKKEWFKVHAKISVMAQPPLPLSVVMTKKIVWKCPLSN